MEAGAPAAGAAYRLDELGWLQFERLCDHLLDAWTGPGARLYWRGQADDARVATLPAGLVLPGALAGTFLAGAAADAANASTPAGAELRLPGTVTVAVIWVSLSPRTRSRRVDLRARADLVARVADLASRHRPAADDPNGGTLLVLTNLAAAPVHAVGPLGRPQPGGVVVFGCDEIGCAIDGDPAVRLAMPSVLGLRDLAPLIDATAGAASPSFDLAGATALARVFSPTRAFDRARAVVGRHRFVVLTGPPEMGKTAIARMIGLAKLTDGWEVHECTNPDQVWRAYDPRRRQLFVADDAFGSTEYRPDAAERWAEHLARLLRALDDHHWLIWTSRPAPLKAGLRRVQRERGSERFPAPAEILVDAGDLDLAEKTLILFRHAKAHGVDGGTRRLVRTSAVAIVEHPHFTPERIRRFVADRLDALAQAGDTAGVAAAVERELQAPTAAMTASFAALEPEHRDLLIALLDAPAGLVDDRELAAAVRRHHRGGLTHPPAELIDRLTDHFLKLTPLGIGWIHPSWRDLVIDELRADAAARQAFLGAAGIDGVLLVLSTAGGAGGERGLPLLVADADWDLCTDRIVELIRRLEDKDVARLLLALDDVSRVELPPAQQREAAGLAASALAAARRTWDARGRPLPVFLLERWYQLNAGPGATAPQLSLTWAELHPAPDATAPADRSELERADDWLALAALLAEHDPAANSRFGFPLREQRTLARLIDAAAGPAAAGDEAAASVLRRIQTLVRSGALDALAAAAASAPRPATEPQHDWWVPADLDVPPSDEPAAAAAARFRREDVARVLRDL